MTAPITLQLNGRSRQVNSDPATPLLYVLRDELALNGAKFGCGLGRCGVPPTACAAAHETAQIPFGHRCAGGVVSLAAERGGTGAAARQPGQAAADRRLGARRY